MLIFHRKFVYSCFPFYLQPELLTSSPTLPSNLIHVCWSGPESIVMATEESCLHVLDIARKTPMSPVENNKGN
jgi:hypothetical protein